MKTFHMDGKLHGIEDGDLVVSRYNTGDANDEWVRVRVECNTDKSVPVSARFAVQAAQAVINAAPLVAQVMDIIGGFEWSVRNINSSEYAIVIGKPQMMLTETKTNIEDEDNF